MCAAVLMAESWKPTVIHLVPFSHNTNTIAENHFTSSETEGAKRNFPVLAVTRTNSGSASRRDSTYTEVSQTTDTKDEETENQHTGNSARSDNLRSSEKMEQSILDNSEGTRDGSDPKYTVQDLNEQLHNMNSKDSHSNVDTRTMTSNVAISDTAIQALPKPILTEGNFYYGQNGMKRTIKLTPGEIELQKHKENYAKEQAQKRKKYKLNVNQLPRSNTPINDHDPDKLNMKQVIQFLQNQKDKAIPKANGREMNYQESVSKPNSTLRFRKHHILTFSEKGPNDKIYLQVSRRDQELKNSSRSTIASRDSNCASVLSTRSVPILEKRQHRQGSQNSSISSKSVIDRSERKRQSRKHVKEFKLHRFLALAPNGQGQTTVPLGSSGEKEALSQDETGRSPKIFVPEDKWVDSGPELFYRSPVVKDGYSGGMSEIRLNGMEVSSANIDKQTNNDIQAISRTASVARRRAVKQQHHQQKHRYRNWREHSESAQSTDDDYKKSNTIRLPSVHDFDDSVLHCGHSDDNTEDISESDYNDKIKVTDLSSMASNSCISSIDESPLLSSRSDQSYNRLVNKNAALYLHKTVLESNSHKTKKLLINVPNEGEHNSEVIKLTLRQEKDVTRERSYMHDIATPRLSDSFTMMYQPYRHNISTSSSFDSCMDRNVFKISSVSMQHRKVHDSIMEEPALSVNETLAKSCIKVRQKLRGNLHND